MATTLAVRPPGRRRPPAGGWAAAAAAVGVAVVAAVALAAASRGGRHREGSRAPQGRAQGKAAARRLAVAAADWAAAARLVGVVVWARLRSAWADDETGTWTALVAGERGGGGGEATGWWEGLMRGGGE